MNRLHLFAPALLIASSDRIVVLATVVFAATTALLAWVGTLAALCAIMIVAGVGWITLMSVLAVEAQVSVPAWVRARGIGTYQLAAQGALAAGSAGWGAVAGHVGTPLALKFVGLHSSQQLSLRAHRHMTDLIKEDRSLICLFEQSSLGGPAGCSLATKHFAVRYCLRQCRTVAHDERPISTRR